MIDPRAGRAAFRVAILILVTALAMLPLQRAGSAEQVVTALSVGVGLLFIGAVALATRLSSPRLPAPTRDKAAAQRSNTDIEDPGRVR